MKSYASTKSNLSYSILGAIVGSGTTLLFTPTTGQKLRKGALRSSKMATNRVVEVVKDTDAGIRGIFSRMSRQGKKKTSEVGKATKAIEKSLQGASKQVKSKLSKTARKVS